jgi:hypothetical protein
MSEFLYRVCTLNPLDASIEEEYNLPGGKFSLTGFFYQDIKNAITLWTERNDNCIRCAGGGTWSVIIRVRKASCTLEKDFFKYKTGYDSILDQNECFVSKIQNNAIIEKYKNGIWESIPISTFNKEG